MTDASHGSREQTLPDTALEYLDACPVCKGTDRAILESGLIDDTFQAIGGEWTLWQCDACSSAYLDPRLNEDSIAKAYSRYYTHEADAAVPPPWARFDGLRRYLALSYINARFGSAFKPALPFGLLLRLIRRNWTEVIDAELRNLPRLPVAGGSILDIGCGNGGFLAHARTLGWEVEGVEPDPDARMAAQKNGIKVTGDDLDMLVDAGRRFDIVMMSHVIEHVHDPAAVLRDCRQLLKAGGRLWVETPNIDSRGYRKFGRYWRGIEAPRHLVLFNRCSLQTALEAAGFHDVRDEPVGNVAPGLFAESRALELGQERTKERLQALMAEFSHIPQTGPEDREFIRLSATPVS